MKTLSFIFSFFLIPTIGFNQTSGDSIQLRFHVLFGDSAAKSGVTRHLGHNNYQLKSCRFYISNFQLFDENHQLIETYSEAKLLDIENPESLQFLIANSPRAKYVKFGVGIDSLTNVSGAYGGTLDPTNGMYWSWQSGYINLKIEGNYIAPRVKKFEYHLGGYLGENACYFTSAFMPISATIEVYLALDQFIQKAETLSVYKVMSPSADAVKLSRAFAQLLQPATK